METVLNQSLSHQEAFSAIISMRYLPELVDVLIKLNFPPVWYICQWIVFNYLGTDEIYIRGLALVFSILSGMFTYKIGSFLWNKRTGFIAALLTLTNPILFAHSFEAGSYSMMVLGATASTYCFLRIFYNEERVRRRDKIGYVFFSLWSLYSNQFTFLATIVHIIWGIYELIFGKRARAKKLFKLILITMTGFLPWFILTFNHSRETYFQIFASLPLPTDVIGFFFNYFSGNILYKEVKLPLLNINAFQASLYLLVVVLVLRKWWKSIKKTIFLVMSLTIPTLFTWFFLYKLPAAPINNYLIYTIPVLSLIISSSRSKFSIIPIILLLISFIFADYYYFINPSKPAFNKFSEHIRSELKETDFIINIYNNGTHYLWESKYYGISAPLYISNTKLPDSVDEKLIKENEIIKEIPQGVEKLVVISNGTIEEAFFPGYTEGGTEIFGNLKLIRYEKVIQTDR